MQRPLNLPCANHAVPETADTVDERVRATTNTKLYKLIFVINHVLGIRILPTRQTAIGNISRISYVLVLASFGVWIMARQVKTFMQHRLKSPHLSYVSHSEHFIVLAVAYVAIFRNYQISQFTYDLLHKFSQIPASKEADKRCRRWTCIIWTFAIVYAISYVSYVVYRITLMTDYLDGSTPYFLRQTEMSRSRLYYFGIETSFTVHEVLECAENLVSIFIVICSDFYWAFMAFLCFLMKECYQRLNEHFEETSNEDFVKFKKNHQEISRLIERFNELFSPALIVLFIIHMIQLINTLSEISEYIMKQGYPSLVIAIILQLSKMLIEFLTLTYFGHHIRYQAQDGLNVLLDVSIGHFDSLDGYESHNKKFLYKIIATNLFAAQLVSSPAAITASGLFNIDFSLITIVISIAFTYFTITSTFSPSNTDNNSSLEPTHSSATSTDIISLDYIN